MAKLVLTEEERVVDQELGYPRGYAKLCRHALAGMIEGFSMPFSAGPPQRFVPYSLAPVDITKLKEWDALFPAVAEVDKEAPNSHKYAEELWEQLDHLGNAGFDPAKFRVDKYGNVLYWSADPSSPLSWEVDHWFPHSRGGQTLASNLQIVQWQTRQRKRNRLEFLVPWWDLQHGVSINQFLSAFASKNSEFRRRSFALFFSGGEDENVVRQHVGDYGSWPPQFREQKIYCGLAGAAIVSLSKENYDDDGFFSSHSSPSPANFKLTSLPGQRTLHHLILSLEASTTFLFSEFVDLKTFSSGRSVELRLKIMREEGKREKSQEITQLEETVQTLKEQNEKERVALMELEGVLSKQKQRIEKQRRWAETQSSYRLCLERMIRDTMHQSISYKEQARLNQAACNALMARLDCQKMTCETAEKDLLQRYSQRQALATLASMELSATEENKSLKGRDIVDVSSCLSLITTNEGHILSPDKVPPEQEALELCSESEDGNAYDVHSMKIKHDGSMESLKSQQNQRCFQESQSGKTTDIISGQVEKKLAVLKSCHYIDENSNLKDEEQGNGGEGNESDDSELNEYDKVHEVHRTEVTDEAFSNGRCLTKDCSSGVKTENKSSNGFQGSVSSSVGEKAFDLRLECCEKDVLMVETKTFVQGERGTAADLQNRREIDDLQQASTTTDVEETHHQKSEAVHENDPMTLEDESIYKIGKSNIDKWLHVLLEDAASPRISIDDASLLHPLDSPSTGQPPLSPALSSLSMAALRGSIELDEGRDIFLRKEDAASKSKGRWGGLMRKLSVKHLDELYEEEPPTPQRDNRNNLRNALKSFEDFKMHEDIQERQEAPAVAHVPEGDGGASPVMLQNIPESVKNWPEGGIRPKGGAGWYKHTNTKITKEATTATADDQLHNSKSTQGESVNAAETTPPKFVEAGELDGDEECDSSTDTTNHQFMDPNDGASKHRLRASLKACTSKWRRAVKKLDSKPLQEGCIPLQV
ncbi:unnamed protein product [Sphagnum balticum]